MYQQIDEIPLSDEEESAGLLEYIDKVEDTLEDAGDVVSGWWVDFSEFVNRGSVL
jgi:hypothetical protein